MASNHHFALLFWHCKIPQICGFFSCGHIAGSGLVDVFFGDVIFTVIGDVLSVQTKHLDVIFDIPNRDEQGHTQRKKPV